MTPNSSDSGKPFCFVISPFGEEFSQDRSWSDCLLRNIIEPAVNDRFQVCRTIDKPEPGSITDRIHRDIDQADMVVADISDNNANVFYEIGLRHGRGLPFVLIRRADADVRVPFNLSTFEVISVEAAWNGRQYLLGSTADIVARLRAEVEAAMRRKRLPRVLESGLYRVRVFDWVTSYSKNIASDWLGKQTESFQNIVRNYERGTPHQLESDDRIALAEYLSLKSAASQVWEGDILYFLNTVTKELAVGYAAYQFPTGPLVIRLTGSESGDGVAHLTFDQPERHVSVGDLQVTLPRYKFTVPFHRDETGRFNGVIRHPGTGTQVGSATLTSKWGFRADD